MIKTKVQGQCVESLLSMQEGYAVGGKCVCMPMCVNDLCVFKRNNGRLKTSYQNDYPAGVFEGTGIEK